METIAINSRGVINLYIGCVKNEMDELDFFFVFVKVINIVQYPEYLISYRYIIPYDDRSVHYGIIMAAAPDTKKKRFNTVHWSGSRYINRKKIIVKVPTDTFTVDNLLRKHDMTD